MLSLPKVTNKQFAAADQAFIKACETAKLPASKRQASKWRNKKGLVWKTAKGEVK